MGMDPAAILAAFSSCFCGPWADRTPQTVRNAPITFVLVILSFLSRQIIGWSQLTYSCALAPSTCSVGQSVSRPRWEYALKWLQFRGFRASCRKVWHCRRDLAAEWLLQEPGRQRGPGIATTKES